MVAHTTFVFVACAYVAHDTGAFHAALLLLTSLVMTLMVNKSLADNSRRLALAAWAIVVSLAWAVFVARAP